MPYAESIYDNQARDDGAPDIRVLWNRTHVSSKPRLLACGCAILKGKRYRSVGLIVDGKYEFSAEHQSYSECPLNW